MSNLFSKTLYGGKPKKIVILWKDLLELWNKSEKFNYSISSACKQPTKKSGNCYLIQVKKQSLYNLSIVSFHDTIEGPMPLYKALENDNIVVHPNIVKKIKVIFPRLKTRIDFHEISLGRTSGQAVVPFYKNILCTEVSSFLIKKFPHASIMTGFKNPSDEGKTLVVHVDDKIGFTSAGNRGGSVTSIALAKSIEKLWMEKHIEYLMKASKEAENA